MANGRRKTAEERFKALMIEGQGDDCWQWNGYRDAGGYGMFWADGRVRLAHRWAYSHWVGPVPPGMQLDHFACDNPACVNPQHLRPVTSRENVLRSNGVSAWFAAQTHCKRGHEFTGDNTIIDVSGSRRCRICTRLIEARKRARKRERRRLAAGDHCS